MSVWVRCKVVGKDGRQRQKIDNETLTHTLQISP